MTLVASVPRPRCRAHEYQKQKCWCDVKHLRCAYCGKPKSKEFGWGVPTKTQKRQRTTR